MNFLFQIAVFSVMTTSTWASKDKGDQLQGAIKADTGTEKHCCQVASLHYPLGVLGNATIQWPLGNRTTGKIDPTRDLRKALVEKCKMDISSADQILSSSIDLIEKEIQPIRNEKQRVTALKLKCSCGKMQSNAQTDNDFKDKLNTDRHALLPAF